MPTLWELLSESEKENIMFFKSLRNCTPQMQKYKLLERFEELFDYLVPERRDAFFEYFMLIMTQLDAYYQFLMKIEFKRGLHTAASEVREKARFEKATRKYVEIDTTEGTSSNDTTGFEDSFVEDMDNVNIKNEFDQAYGSESPEEVPEE